MKRRLKGHAADSISRTPLLGMVEHIDAVYQQPKPVDDGYIGNMTNRAEALLGEDRAKGVVAFMEKNRDGHCGPKQRHDLHTAAANGAADGSPDKIILAQRAADIKRDNPAAFIDPSKTQQDLTALMDRVMRRDSAQPAQ